MKTTEETKPQILTQPKEEIWKNIVGYEDSYQVSNLGRVRSIDRYVRTGENHLRKIRGKILKQQVSNKGYLFVTLSRECEESGMFVHVLVAKAFIDNPHFMPQVNHKDENKRNNNVENLEWCTSKYNNNYGTHNDRVRQKTINGKQSKEISRYSVDGKYIDSFPSMMEAQRQLGISAALICHCCKGRIKAANGYIWKYK
ncbi:MAG: HNH endonuclease [Bacteroidaceae bacterium]|nr:HNH endonuclease [Bacteroidaceae bacterium]